MTGEPMMQADNFGGDEGYRFRTWAAMSCTPSMDIRAFDSGKYVSIETQAAWLTWQYLATPAVSRAEGLEPSVCTGCEGRPSLENSPCAVCRAGVASLVVIEPLTDAKIDSLWYEALGPYGVPTQKFARAIEAAHGITGVPAASSVAKVAWAVTMTDEAILKLATDLFPRWREDIQEQFVLMLSNAVLSAQLGQPFPRKDHRCNIDEVARPICRALEMLTAYAELVKATDRYAEEHYIPEVEHVISELQDAIDRASAGEAQS